MSRTNLVFNCFWLLLVGSWLWEGCSGAGSPKDCLYGQPVAIFADDLPNMLEHQFEQKAQEAKELMRFNNGLRVELTQSGCDEIVQEFRFELADSLLQGQMIEPLALAVGQLAYMGSLGPEYQGFQEWARALAGQKEEFKLSQPMELGPGIGATVDQIKGGGLTTIVLTFKSQ